MLKFKRVVIVWFAFLCLFTLLPHTILGKPLEISPNFEPISVKTLKNIGPAKLPEISVRAIKNGIKPAFLKNVEIKLKKQVNWLTDEQATIIRENAENGIIDENLVPFVKPGEIYADPNSLLAIKFISGENGKLVIMEADDDIVEDISIPEQKVFLNDANIVKLTPGINAVSMRKKSADIEGTGFTFYFDEQKKLPGYDKEGKLVEIALQGFIILDAPLVEVKYSKNKGYKFIFYASENSQINVKFHADLKKDVKIPLYEYSIPAEGCKVNIGFYLFIGVDGSISLTYSITQNASVKAGIHGDTSYFIPTSFKTVKELNFKLNADNVSLTADLKGEASILAEVLFEVVNTGKIVLDNKIGVLLDVKSSVQGSSDDYLKIKGDGFVKISGKINVKSFDKSKDIFEYKYPIFNYVKERASNYQISISDACAYNDIIKGSIIQDNHPYVEKEITIKITDNTGAEKNLTTKTDKNGNFSVRYNLKKGDFVSVKIPGTSNRFSEKKEATFPYDEVFLEKVDYLENIVKGYINAGDNIPKYNGLAYVVIERTNNLPLNSSGDLSIPVTYPIKLQVQVTNGAFQISNFDIRPFDKVYALLESEGFVISSNKIESTGMNVAVDGGYVQEPDMLSSPNSVVIFSYEGAASPSIYNPNLFVKVYYPKGNKKDEVKEFKLKLKSVQGVNQIISSTGPWDMVFGNYMEQISTSFGKFKGTYSKESSYIDYQVWEEVNFFVEGKRFEYENIAKKSDDDRKKSILGYVEKNKIKGSKNVGYDRDIFIKEQDFNIAPISAKNFTADVQINYYNSPTSLSPTYYRNAKFTVLNEKQRLDGGLNDLTILWDKTNRTKIIKNNEFQNHEAGRYDLDDYIPEFKDVKFVYKSVIAVNGILCNYWEKSFKINQYSTMKLEVFTSKDSGLPIKAIFYDGNLQKVEIIFSNWQRVTEKI